MKLTQWFFLTCLITGSATAQDIQLEGSIKQLITPPNTSHVPLLKSSLPTQVALLKINLSDKAQQTFGKRINDAINAKSTSTLSTWWLPRKLQLGMSNVPVLNQGAHGTCVTFANTAAVDAALNKGDYISQLCSLALGSYIAENAYTVSGWDGALGGMVLNQMDVFGIVSNEQQRANGCGGLTEYPLNGEAPDTGMPASEYHQISEHNEQISWTPLVDIYDVVLDKTNMNTTLNNVKKALNAGDRLTFGVLLLNFDQGVVGAIGTHKSTFDSWLLTPEMAADLNDQTQFAGHEMVITGYDDYAYATDTKGRKHYGLLTLRNSWGSHIGDKGDFYMSYDYFKALAIEVQRIRSLPTPA